MQTNTTSTDAETLLAAFGVTAVLTLAVYLLVAIGLMRFFRAADRPGWAAFVPIYNYYIMNELAGLPMYWFWLLVGSIVLSFLPLFGSLLALIVGIYITYKFLERYGKDAVSTALAVLFPYAYFPIVGNSKDLRYTPPVQVTPTDPGGPVTPQA